MANEDIGMARSVSCLHMFYGLCLAYDGIIDSHKKQAWKLSGSNTSHFQRSQGNTTSIWGHTRSTGVSSVVIRNIGPTLTGLIGWRSRPNLALIWVDPGPPVKGLPSTACSQFSSQASWPEKGSPSHGSSTGCSQANRSHEASWLWSLSSTHMPAGNPGTSSHTCYMACGLMQEEAHSKCQRDRSWHFQAWHNDHCNHLVGPHWRNHCCLHPCTPWHSCGWKALQTRWAAIHCWMGVCRQCTKPWDSQELEETLLHLRRYAKQQMPHVTCQCCPTSYACMSTRPSTWL